MSNNFSWSNIQARLNELNDIEDTEEEITPDLEDQTIEDVLIDEPDQQDDIELMEDDDLVLEFEDIMSGVSGTETVDEIEDSIIDTIDDHDTDFNDSPIEHQNDVQDEELAYVWQDTTNFLVSAKRLTDVIADIIYQPEHYLPHVDDFNFTGRYNIMTINAVQGLVVSFEYESMVNTSVVEVIVQINDNGVEIIGAN